MLLQFSVENYTSIKNKCVLDLTPTVDKEHPENILMRGEQKALNVITVYGANASGKSNLFKAMTSALNIIRNSENTQINMLLPIMPFKFDGSSQTKPSSFEFTFVANDEKKYVYGFSATPEEITEEYLYCYNSAKPSVIFDFTYKAELPEYKFSRSSKSELVPLLEKRTKNKLFISTATAWNATSTKVAFEWLATGVNTITNVNELSNVSLDKYRTDDSKEYIQFAKMLMKHADINISDFDINITETEVSPLSFMINGQTITPAKNYNVEVLTSHLIKDENGQETKYKLNLQEESLGTNQLFLYAPLLKDIIDNGATLFVDELDKSLHPFIVKYIINMFRDESINKNGAQLIATTHETVLLSLDMLRRDQIYFTEKDSDTGITSLYSLNEFSVRKSDNVEKGYLLGRYGAIPLVYMTEVI